MDITITSSAYDRSYNCGVYTTPVREITPDKLYMVSIESEWLLGDMLIAWGFARSKAEVSPLTETLVASCELIYFNIKEHEHANV